jgi:trimethylamine--corrinoid protein Co-methyltransferase
MRPALLADYEAFCKLAQTSDHLDMNGYLMVEPSDAAPGLSYLEMMLANLLLCDRPFMGAQTNRQASREAIQMAAMACGGEEAIRANPPMVPIISVMSPLHYSAEMAGALIEYAQAGQPVMCCSATMAGSSGPVTLAGVLALTNAESLTGLILSQLINPGNPFIYGATSAPMDMRSGGMCIGAVETSLLISGTLQLARFYNLPSRSGGTLTDAPFPDYQAGVESTLGLTTAVRNGANFILHSAGILSSFMAMSFEKFLLDEELCGMVRKLISPLDLSAEAIDLEMIETVGVGGHYLTQPKTFKLCRTEFFLPRLFSRLPHGQWTEAGRPRPEERATKALEARLAAYEKPDIDPALEADLKRFVDQRKG